MKKFGAYVLICFGGILGLLGILSTLTSIPQFMELDISQPYNWGYIAGRVITIILLLVIAKASINKGKKLKTLVSRDA
ncbi:hypothetical protein [Shewanella algae]|uniref:hypothetical protein n=1 Tax=Shewanella algae TaxID=38313 RepID=UPI001BF0D76B|nr:hypothetical protein [Shewanella algae]BCV48517.1 hypothetical protein TUM17382_12100 [Shewanella algae]